MDAKTLTALKASIKHWQDNVDAETPDYVKIHSSHCALCALSLDKDCLGCPVYGKTGYDRCVGSPWHFTYRALSEWREERSKANKSAWQKAAQAELDFLKSLLPEGEM